MDLSAFEARITRLQHDLGTFLTSRSFVNEQDKQEVLQLIREISSVSGPVNTLLSEFPELLVQISWIAHKYNVRLIEASRAQSKAYNAKYVSLRERGYNEWTAKSMAEMDPEVLKMQIARDALDSVASFFSRLVDACNARKSILEQMSNNLRVDLKTSV